jgi:hypothetical protein
MTPVRQFTPPNGPGSISDLPTNRPQLCQWALSPGTPDSRFWPSACDAPYSKVKAVMGRRSQPRHRPAEATLPSDGQCNAALCYSLNATPLNAATPGALDVATWVKSP